MGNVKFSKLERRLILIALNDAERWAESLVDAHMDKYSGKPMVGHGHRVRTWKQCIRKYKQCRQRILEYESSATAQGGKE